MSVLLLIASSFFGLLSPEATSTCLFQPPSIEVTTQFDGPTLDRSRSSSMLASDFGSNPAGYVTQGLTKTQTYLRRNISVAMHTMRDGKLCANIEKISVHVGLQGPAQVFIASEIKPGSCRDRTTIEHEQLHINHAFEAQQKTKLVIEKNLAVSLRRIMPVVANEREQASALAASHLDRLLDQMIAPVDAERTAKDRAIDTSQSYRRLTTACP